MNLKFMITQVEIAKKVILNYFCKYKKLLLIKERETSTESTVNMTRNMIQMPNSIW